MADERARFNNTIRKSGFRRWVGPLFMVPAATGLAVGALAVSSAGASVATAKNSFAQMNLVAGNSSFGAKLVDPNLANPWGLAAAPTSPIWVSDNNSGHTDRLQRRG